MIRENRIPIEQLSEKSTEKRKSRVFLDLYARQWMSGMLLLTDLLCLFAGILLGLQLRLLSANDLPPAYNQIFALLAIILVIKFYRTGLYPGVGLHYIDEFRKLVSSITTTFVIVLAVTVLLHTSLIYSRLAILYSWMFSILLIPVGRYLIRRFLIHLGLWGVPVVIIGVPEKALALAEQLRVGLQQGFRPALIISDETSLAGGFVVDSDLSLAKIKENARRLHLNDAFILVDDLNNIDLLVDRYRFIFHRVILVKDQTGKYGLNNLEPLDFESALGLQVRNSLLSKWVQFLKMVIDKLVAFFGLLLLAPFFALAAVAIKLDSPGRIFYRQLRLGKGGKTFRLLKFRTMYINANEVLKLKLARNPVLKAEWEDYQKLKEDPRITRVGMFLRKLSLDELPQLWNVFIGEMSTVGPRPITPDQSELYGPCYKDYIQVTPGMTGLWQVSGRNQTSFAQRAALDNEYIQRWSIWMDIFIFFKTIKVVLWQNGAY
jgi:Undecaprenyl-phosphate galactose phosphotransferase WbaP